MENKKNKIGNVMLVLGIIFLVAIIGYVIFGAVKGEKNPIATMQVSYVDSEGNEKEGTMKFELYPENAPITVANFVKLANNGFYNDLTFHRIMKDFMIQGGDKEGTGSGSAKISDLDKSVEANSENDYTYSIKGEFESNGVNNKIRFEKGVIAMARSDYSSYGLTEEGYNSASSQFFIVNTDGKEQSTGLNGSYAPFGKITEGMDVLDALSNVAIKESEGESSESSTPEVAPVIKSVTVETFGADYGMPKTLNYDDTLSKVEQYRQYYEQMMSQYNASSNEATEDTAVETNEDQTVETQNQ